MNYCRGGKKSEMENENDFGPGSFVEGQTISEVSQRFDLYAGMIDHSFPVEDIPRTLCSKSVDFLNENTAKGQLLILECISRWARGGSEADLLLNRKLISDIIGAFCSAPSSSGALSSLIECMDARNLSQISSESLLDLIRRACGAVASGGSSHTQRSRSSVSKPGGVAKQLIGCIKIATNLIQSMPSFQDRLHELSPEFARVISVSTFDRALRETCYNLLSVLISDSSEIPPLGLEPAQERELRSRVEKRSFGQTTLIIHPSIASSTHDCTISTPSLSSARSSKIGKECMTRIRGCAKWQDKRDHLMRLSKEITSTISNDFMSDFTQFFKDESNVPVLVACFELVNSFASSAEVEVHFLRKLLFLCILKLREKNPSVHRVIKTTVPSILNVHPDFCDSALISHLCEVTKLVTRRDVLDLVLHILSFITSISDRCRLIQQLIAPALAETSTRECALRITRQVIADTASDSPSKLEEIITVVEKCTDDLSSHRKRVIRDALGLAVQQDVPAKIAQSPPRSPPKIRTGNSDVSLLVRALLEGHSLVEPCSRIRASLESSASVQDSRLIEVIAKSVKPVLIGEDPESRKAVLALIHTATRMVSIWETASVREMRIFLDEMLIIVDDKSLRENDPEVWSDINLSVVHAVANCKLPTAYAALIEVSGPKARPSIQGLALKCIEKLNKALPEYFEANRSIDNSATLWPLLGAVLAYIVSDSVTPSIQVSLKGICSAVSALDIGEFLGTTIPDKVRREYLKEVLKQQLSH